MTDNTKGEFLTITQARELAGCDRSTIYKWFTAKKLTRYVVGGGRPRVKRTELEALITPRPAVLSPDRADAGS